MNALNAGVNWQRAFDICALSKDSGATRSASLDTAVYHQIMAPKSKSKKKQQKAAMAKTKVPRTVAGGLDEAARKMIRLLADPCGADMSPPLYAGTGTGYLVRTRQVIFPPGNATDYYIEFCPGYGSPAASMGNYGYSSTVGGPLGTKTAIAYPGFITAGNVAAVRCVAACLKASYQGTVNNCAGRVGLVSTPGSSVLANASATLQSAYSYQHACQAINHFSQGEKLEIRWVPSFSDQEFFDLENGAINTGASAIGMVVSAMTPGTAAFEITAVWEWTPSETFSSGASSNLVPQVKTSMSSFTLNDVLNTISRVSGGLTAFATNPTIMGAAQAGFKMLAPSLMQSSYSQPRRLQIAG